MDFSSAIVSRAVHGDSWTVHLYPESPTAHCLCLLRAQGPVFDLEPYQKASASAEGQTDRHGALRVGREGRLWRVVMYPASATEETPRTSRITLRARASGR